MKNTSASRILALALLGAALGFSAAGQQEPAAAAELRGLANRALAFRF